MKMKAVVNRRYGPPEVLQLAEVEKPTPKENEVLIQVRATSVSAGDWRMRKPSPFAARLYNGLLRPKRITILGFELAGVVEAVGGRVTRFQPGDEVFAMAGFGFGGYAEYRCLPERADHPDKGFVCRKPANLTFEEAAVIPCGAITALGIIRQVNVRPGQKVLVYGASGSVGCYAVQLAWYYGAEVTAVCSTANVEMVRSLGAVRVIDYTRTDFSRTGETYDIVFDAVGKAPRADCRRVLKPGGVYTSVRHVNAEITGDDMETLRGLAETGELQPVIDRCYTLDEIVAAHHYVERGHKRGNVAVTV